MVAGERRTSVQNGTAWRAWRRADQFRQVGFFRGKPVQARPGSARWDAVRPPPRDDRPYKSCRRVTQSGQVPRPRPANCRCGGGLPVDQAACRRLDRSRRQKRRREHDGKAVARMHPRRARWGSSPPTQPLHCKRLPCTVAVTESNRCTGSSINRSTSMSGSTVDWLNH